MRKSFRAVRAGVLALMLAAGVGAAWAAVQAGTAWADAGTKVELAQVEGTTNVSVALSSAGTDGDVRALQLTLQVKPVLGVTVGFAFDEGLDAQVEEVRMREDGTMTLYVAGAASNLLAEGTLSLGTVTLAAGDGASSVSVSAAQGGLRAVARGGSEQQLLDAALPAAVEVAVGQAPGPGPDDGKDDGKDDGGDGSGSGGSDGGGANGGSDGSANTSPGAPASDGQSLTATGDALGVAPTALALAALAALALLGAVRLLICPRR